LLRPKDTAGREESNKGSWLFGISSGTSDHFRDSADSPVFPITLYQFEDGRDSPSARKEISDYLRGELASRERRRVNGYAVITNLLVNILAGVPDIFRDQSTLDYRCRKAIEVLGGEPSFGLRREHERKDRAGSSRL